MKPLRLLCLSILASAALAAEPLDSTYTLPEALPDWVVQSSSTVRSGRKITNHAVYSPDRTHVITMAFVGGYRDHEISQDHFKALVNSFAREGLKEVLGQRSVTRYGLPGAEVTAQGVVQGRDFKGRGVILKRGEFELTIMMFAVGIALDSPAFEVALSGLGLGSK